MAKDDRLPTPEYEDSTHKELFGRLNTTEINVASLQSGLKSGVGIATFVVMVFGGVALSYITQISDIAKQGIITQQLINQIIDSRQKESQSKILENTKSDESKLKYDESLKKLEERVYKLEFAIGSK